jgi:riboflavin kinase/FMN adenylyltransferase
MLNFDIEGGRVSSTRIRSALARGDLRGAEKLLGRSYRMSGRIIRGDARGRTIGFPTANIHRHRPAALNRSAVGPAPLSGVFAVEVFGLENEPLRGVANVGVRPTVDGRKCMLEVHLLDFDGDLYGRHVQVVFRIKLREERRFDTIEALRQQIVQDVAQARDFFTGLNAVQPDALSVSG